MSAQTYTRGDGQEYTVASIVFEGPYESYNNMQSAERRAKELAENGRVVTVINALVEPNGDILALRYEAVVEVSEASDGLIGGEA